MNYGKPKVLLPRLKKKGLLAEFGYSNIKTMTPQQRQKALNLALHYLDPLELFRRLNEIYVLNKNRPIGQLFLQDRNYVHQFLQES